ncbi:CG0192-related protein [Aeromicrobium sp. P5_D10]
MALLHAAEIRPSKIELIRAWAPTQPWFVGDDVGLESIGAYRFDDPDGQVGIETILVRSPGGPTLQVPLTYRGEPLAGADEWLITTMEHTVLGPRWIYDACGDPVYAAALAATILGGGSEALLERDTDGVREPVEPSVRVVGSGSETDVGSVGLVDVRDVDAATLVATSVADIEVLRVLGDSWALGGKTLTGTWDGQSDPVLLAVAR